MPQSGSHRDKRMFIERSLSKKTSEKLVASRIEEESRSPNAAERQSSRQAHSDEGAIVYRLGQEIFIL